jgi:hypothetical protein
VLRKRENKGEKAKGKKVRGAFNLIVSFIYTFILTKIKSIA